MTLVGSMGHPSLCCGTWVGLFESLGHNILDVGTWVEYMVDAWLSTWLVG